MCRISSLDEPKTVIMAIQINSARSEFVLDGNDQLRSNRLDFIQYCCEESKRKRERLWRTNFMAYNVRSHKTTPANKTTTWLYDW